MAAVANAKYRCAVAVIPHPMPSERTSEDSQLERPAIAVYPRTQTFNLGTIVHYSNLDRAPPNKLEASRLPIAIAKNVSVPLSKTYSHGDKSRRIVNNAAA